MKRPKFRRQEWWKHKRIGEKWRKPRGNDSKMRLARKGKAPIVKVGYRSPARTRGTHPSGLSEVLVHNLRDLEKIEPTKQAARISSSVGRKLRGQILEKANERRVKILNPGVKK